MMNERAFFELINQTQKYLSETYYGQSKVFLEGQKVPAQKQEKGSKVHIRDLFQRPLEKVKVALLVLSKDPQEQTLIQKMGAAIDSKIAKAQVFDARLIEENDLWKEWRSEMKSLEHVLVSEMEFYQLPKLLLNYQTQPKRQVLGASLFLLADLSSYNQDLELKKSLWATLLKEL